MLTEKTKKKMSKARLERKKRLGYINSPETRKRMSKAQKERFRNNPMPEETKRKTSKALKGRRKPPFTAEHRKNISEAGKMPKPWMRGNKNHFWKGGITELSKRIKSSFKYSKWRETVFERDNWTCQKCSKRGGIIIHPHHKKSFSLILEENDIKTIKDALDCEELWNINNGITLCVICHKKTDNYGWNKHNKNINKTKT